MYFVLLQSSSRAVQKWGPVACSKPHKYGITMCLTQTAMIFTARRVLKTSKIHFSKSQHPSLKNRRALCKIHVELLVVFHIDTFVQQNR